MKKIATMFPFVFAGINVDPTIYEPIESLKKPRGPITGALERYPINETISLGKKILPNSSKIMLLADSSPSSDLVVNKFKEQFLDNLIESPLNVLGFFQVETFMEWKEKIVEYQNKTDIIGVLNYHQLRNENGNIVPTSEVEKWMRQNNQIPEIGTMPTYAENGYLAVAGVSYYRNGIYVGILGGRILNGDDPGMIPIIDLKVIDIYFNLERADMLGIKIPALELVEAVEVFNTIEGTN